EKRARMIVGAPSGSGYRRDQEKRRRAHARRPRASSDRVGGIRARGGWGLATRSVPAEEGPRRAAWPYASGNARRNHGDLPGSAQAHGATRRSAPSPRARRGVRDRPAEGRKRGPHGGHVFHWT